jgi:hypothetical protein
MKIAIDDDWIRKYNSFSFKDELPIHGIDLLKDLATTSWSAAI